MNLDKLKEVFNKFTAQDMPTVVAVLLGIVLLILVLKAGKSLAKALLLLLIAGVLFAGAYWWRSHK